MLQKDLKVKRPVGTKIYRQKTNEYVYHVVGSEYKKDKQYVVESRVCIGKMIDEEYMYPNDHYLTYYPTTPVLTEEQEFSDARQIATVALFWKIMEELGLSDILDEIHGQKATLIRDLVCYVIIQQSSTMQHYADYAWRHLISSKKIESDSQISEFFKDGVGFPQVEEFLVRWNERQTEKKGIYISYDSTNMNTTAAGIDMAELGHAKEDKEDPQVNVSYVVRHSDAMPLLYEMYPGSIIDNSQCTYMVDLVKAYGYTDIGFILDRGYFSAKNIHYMDSNGYGFLLMVKQNSALIKDTMDKARLPLQTKNEYYIPEHGVYGLTQEKKLWTKDEKARYIHVFYDNIRGNEERNRFLDQLQKKEQMLEKKVSEKLRKEEELLSYKQHFRLTYDDYGYLKAYARNKIRIQADTNKLGFFVLITSREMTAEQALSIYRNRDSTEKLFRALKTGLEYDTYRVHSQSSLEGKMYVMFIASIVRNQLFQKLKEIKGNDRKHFTVPAVISELEKVIAIKDRNGQYKRRYGLTAKQKKILSPFGIEDKHIDQIVLQLR